MKKAVRIFRFITCKFLLIEFSNVSYYLCLSVYQITCIVAVTVDHNGSMYELITVPQSYSEARQACQDLDMDLAVITDAEKNAFISGLIR